MTLCIRCTRNVLKKSTGIWERGWFKNLWIRIKLLIYKIYEVDPLECFQCGSEMKIIASIHDYQEIKKISKYLGLWHIQYPQPPPEKSNLYTHMLSKLSASKHFLLNQQNYKDNSILFFPIFTHSSPFSGIFSQISHNWLIFRLWYTITWIFFINYLTINNQLLNISMRWKKEFPVIFYYIFFDYSFYCPYY